jgi:hypothetical protein
LPHGFPYIFEATLTYSWATVGIFIAPELALAIEILEGFGNERAMWLILTQRSPTVKWAICAIYGPPGGDRTFWERLLHERKVIMAKFGITRTLLAGDANIHLPEVVIHATGCACLHCKPSKVEKDIARLLKANGLSCSNPVNVPTHASGTLIDLLITEVAFPPLDTEATVPGAIGRSDHSLVHARTSLSTVCAYSSGFGRVMWTSNTQWSLALGNIDIALAGLASLVERLSHMAHLRSAAAARTQHRLRRKVLDATVWLRDAWCVMCGYLGGLMQTTRPRAPPQQGTVMAPGAISIGTGSNFAQQGWSKSQRMLAKYLSLQQENEGAAAKYMSNLLKPPIHITLALTDPATQLACQGAANVPVVRE